MTKANESLAFISPKGRAQPKIFAYSENVNAEGWHNDASNINGRRDTERVFNITMADVGEI
jgi:hypothetical protein